MVPNYSDSILESKQENGSEQGSKRIMLEMYHVWWALVMSHTLCSSKARKGEADLILPVTFSHKNFFDRERECTDSRSRTKQVPR